MEELKKSIPELPNKKLARYMKDYGLAQIDATILAENIEKARLFEDSIAIGSCKPKSIANWILGDISRILNERNCEVSDTKITPENLCKMIELIDNGTISNTAGKTVLEVIIDEAKEPAAVVEEKGLSQISDASVLVDIAKEVLENNPKAVEDYRGGKTNVLGFLVGQCMRASKGKGNPATLRGIMEELLK